MRWGEGLFPEDHTTIHRLVNWRSADWSKGSPPRIFHPNFWRNGSDLNSSGISTWQRWPAVKVRKASVKHLDGHAYSLKVTVENQGFLPTNINEGAAKSGLARPVR